MKHHRARRTGFTLVELLVVIAIITVLIAIALPVYSRAREKARQTACMANLHQLAVSLRMYALDFGHFPGPYDPATGQGGLNALYPTHLDNRAALICPDDRIASPEDYINQIIRTQLNGAPAELHYADLLERAETMYLWKGWEVPDPPVPPGMDEAPLLHGRAVRGLATHAAGGQSGTPPLGPGESGPQLLLLHAPWHAERGLSGPDQSQRSGQRHHHALLAPPGVHGERRVE